MSDRERVAIINGVRTPFLKAGGAARDLEADDLGAFVVRELLAKTGISGDIVDELIMGNVLQPPHATNVARVLGVKGGLPLKVPAFTVNRNCASGMEAITAGTNMIWLGEADVIIAGGTESMSNFPMLIKKSMRNFLMSMGKAKTWGQRLGNLTKFRPGFLGPERPEIADPLVGLTMGQTAENLVRDFKITRKEQDEFALRSNLRAVKATQDGILQQEITPIPLPPVFQNVQQIDDGPRADTSLPALSKLKPLFEPLTGSVTAGNASQVTDGAAAVLLMRESKAKELGLKPLGYIREYGYAALDPARMGLGPYFATAKLLKRTGMRIEDFDLIEINEAFAAQVLAVLRAFGSAEFAKKHLGQDTALGEIDIERLNVNGGAIALGHPLGASGTRLVLTLLKELVRRKKNKGLATLCVGGGQGEAVAVEVE